MIPERLVHLAFDARKEPYTTSDLARFAAGYEALPEAYKHDSCLEFWVEDNTLCCRPVAIEIAALGSWVYFYNEDSDDWEPCSTLKKKNDQAKAIDGGVSQGPIMAVYITCLITSVLKGIKHEQICLSCLL